MSVSHSHSLVNRPRLHVSNRKTPVLVKSMETAVEIALAFGKERFVRLSLVTAK